MKIAMISTPYLPTPPLKYGAVERVVSMLTERLVQNGHEVTLFAVEGSETSANFAEIPKGIHGQVNEINLIRLLHKDVKNYGDFDIIHNHNSYPCDYFTKKYQSPIITTMHVEAHKYNTKVAKNSQYICISKRQATLARDLGINVAKVIYNPVDTGLYKFNPIHGNKLLFLGGIVPEKGLHIAIEVAEKSEKELLIAGPIHDTEYYESLIKPKLNNSNIEYVGEVNDTEKINLFSNACALLFPILREEAFGLVMTEAMSCGLPVIGFNIGAAPEVIMDNETGFVVNDTSEMVQAVHNLDTISYLACRKRVEEFFSINKITNDHEKLYYKLTNRD